MGPLPYSQMGFKFKYYPVIKEVTSVWSHLVSGWCFLLLCSLCPLCGPGEDVLHSYPSGPTWSFGWLLLLITADLAFTVDYKVSVLCSLLIPNPVLFSSTDCFPQHSHAVCGPRNPQVFFPCFTGVRGYFHRCCQTHSPGMSPCPC